MIPPALRIAIFSDVHANLAALTAVLDAIERLEVDLTFALGDLVGRGPEPEATVRLMRKKRIKTLRGNWDSWIAGGDGWDVRPKRKILVEAARKAMKPRSLARLTKAPETRRLIFDGVTVLLAHGSPRDPVELLVPELPDSTIEEAIKSADADLVVVGHSHRAFVRWIGRTLVVNTGTVGYAFGGDPRASFALLELGRPPRAEIVRVPYSIERNLTAMRRAVKRGVVPEEIELRYRRALLGEGPEPLEPLSPDDRGDEALVKILARPIRDVYQAAASDKIAAESERARRRRAAVRRLKEAFALARPMVVARALERPLYRLDELSHLLGQRRAADVLLFELEACAEEAPAIAARIRSALELRRDRAARRIAEIYTRERLVSQGLLALGAVMRARKNGPGLREAGGALLAARKRSVIAAWPALERSLDPADHHRLRVALRRLRYAANLLSRPFPDLGLKRLAETASSIDDALGRLNDVTLLLDLAESRRGLRLARPDDPTPLVIALTGARKERLLAARSLANENAYFFATLFDSTSFAASSAPAS